LTGLGAISSHTYDFIMSDFAWSFSLVSSKGEAKSAQAQYSVMSLEQIKALPVLDLCTENAVRWIGH
jgi:N6-adenosine-specific RNA methylase IME4